MKGVFRNCNIVVNQLHDNICYDIKIEHRHRVDFFCILENIPREHNVPYLSASAVVIHDEEALYQVYAPLPLPFTFRTIFTRIIGSVTTYRGWSML